MGEDLIFFFSHNCREWNYTDAPKILIPLVCASHEIAAFQGQPGPCIGWMPVQSVAEMSIPRGSVVKNPAANAGDLGSIPGPGRSPGGGNDNPLQYSCLENPMDRGGWQATGHGVAKSQTRLGTHPRLAEVLKGF